MMLYCYMTLSNNPYSQHHIVSDAAQEEMKKKDKEASNDYVNLVDGKVYCYAIYSMICRTSSMYVFI